jgi:hypothetical protein
MADVFGLEITLGNDAMRNRYDIAEALRGVAERIEAGSVDSGKVKDLNGNSVGSWTIG